MKQHYVSLLTTDDEIQDFFMVKNIAVKLGSNKKQYLDLLLADNTGEITAKEWDVAIRSSSLNEIEPGNRKKLRLMSRMKTKAASLLRRNGGPGRVEMSDLFAPLRETGRLLLF